MPNPAWRLRCYNSTEALLRGNAVTLRLHIQLGHIKEKPRIMRGNEQVVEYLNEVLKAELTAINQYFLHAEMMENWRYDKLAKLTKKESIEEMQHAEKLIERILYLEGVPRMDELFPLAIGETVKKQIENDLELEYKAVDRLNKAINVELNATPRLLVTPKISPSMALCACPRASPIPRTVPMKPIDGMAQAI